MSVSVGIYSALLCAPITVVIPIIFYHVAERRQQLDDERRALKRMHVTMVRSKLIEASRSWTLWCAFAFVWLWTAGAMFAILVWGMEVDVSAAANQNAASSAGWLASCATALVFDLTLTSSIIILLRMTWFTFAAQRTLNSHLELRVRVEKCVWFSWLIVGAIL